MVCGVFFGFCVCVFWVLHGCEPLGHAVGDLVVLVNLHQVLVAVMAVRVNHGVIRLRKHGDGLWLRNQGFAAGEVCSLVVVRQRVDVGEQVWVVVDEILGKVLTTNRLVDLGGEAIVGVYLAHHVEPLVFVGHVVEAVIRFKKWLGWNRSVPEDGVLADAVLGELSKFSGRGHVLHGMLCGLLMSF